MNSTDEIIHFWAICIGGKFHNDKQLRTEVIHLNKNKVWKGTHKQSFWDVEEPIHLQEFFLLIKTCGISLNIIIIFKNINEFDDLERLFQKKIFKNIDQRTIFFIQRRAKLVQLITEENYTIAKAAKRLGVKASTARMILNKYKQTGEFPMKQFKKGSKARTRKAHHSESSLLPPIIQEENVDP